MNKMKIKEKIIWVFIQWTQLQNILLKYNGVFINDP